MPRRGSIKPLPPDHVGLQFLAGLRRLAFTESRTTSPDLVEVARAFGQVRQAKGRGETTDARTVAHAARQLGIGLRTYRSREPMHVAVCPEHLRQTVADALGEYAAAPAVTIDPWAVMLSALAGDPAPRSRLGAALPKRHCSRLPDPPGDEHAARWDALETIQLPMHHPEPDGPANVDSSRPGAVVIHAGTEPPPPDPAGECSSLIEVEARTPLPTVGGLGSRKPDPS